MSKSDFSKGRGFAQIIRQETVPLEGQQNKSIETQLWTGHVLFENGEEWNTSGVDVTEMDNGKGTVRGNQVITHRDGSTITNSYTGTVKAVKNSNRFAGTGEWKWTSTTGRLAGAKASGTFSFEQDGDKFTNVFSGTA